MGIFKKAERKQAKLRLGLNGPSGSGKTYSALRLAQGISKKRVAVIDTEKGSASLYSHLFDFDTLEIGPPFTHEKYIAAIEAAEKEGSYDLLIIDSYSHAWVGEGGVLDQKALLDIKPGSNHYANWKKPKDNFVKLKNAIIFSPLHIICCFRAKQSYEQIVDEQGRKKIEKMGMDPQTEPNHEYELTTVLDITMSHHATSSKDRTGIFEGKTVILDEKIGEDIYGWLMEGKEVWMFAKKERDDLRDLMNSIASGKQIVKDWENKNGGFSNITEEKYRALVIQLQAAKEFSEAPVAAE